jgi:6-pyruvoyltetrahydropterin/6-carboxytetrahydropterin synthase
MPHEITRRIEIDAGHRIPHESSRCKHLHGHRYAIEATVRGSLQNRPGDPEEGMVTGFESLKEYMMEELHCPWDHGFFVHRRDIEVDSVLRHLGLKFYELPDPPTAEIIAFEAYKRLSERLSRENAQYSLVCVRVYETPNCWADYRP